MLERVLLPSRRPLGAVHLIDLGEALRRGLPGLVSYSEWLETHFGDVAFWPLAERHRRLWRWFEGLTSNVPDRRASPAATSRPRVEVWPRGGGKSATAELGCAYLASRLTRRFVLYVSATQGQADLHVQSIGGLLERLGVRRALSAYGNPRGWRRSQLRTADGFHVAAYGLDGASRGIKIDRYRPDLIIFDDIDSQSDTAAAVRRKIEAITTAILPTGASDCAVLFLQNLIHEDGVVAQLVDGRAGFLLDREVGGFDPAVWELEVAEGVGCSEGLTAKGAKGAKLGGDAQRKQNGPGGEGVSEIGGSGTASPCPLLLPGTNHPGKMRGLPVANVYRIVAGEATWEGQSIETCERQINEWGLRAFLREAQHEVQAAGGHFFNSSRFEVVDQTPNLERVCLAWDLAATEGGGDHTVSVLMGRAASGVVYVLHVSRGQYGSERVRELILKLSGRLRDRFPHYSIRLPQDPGQAGKAQADQLRRLLSGFRNVRIEAVTGSKAVRAAGYAEMVNLGNVKLLRGPWNSAFMDEHRRFREDLSHEFDDQIDAASDAFNDLSTPTGVAVSQRISPNPMYRTHQFVGGRRELEEDDEDED